MKKRILVVDDFPAILASYRELLTDFAAYAVDTAEDGLEAVFKMSRNQYDAVVMNIMMPEPNGIEVLRYVKTKPYGQMPIIICSGAGTMKDKETCLALGAFGYISKPFNIERLLNMLDEAVNGKPTSEEF